VAATAFRFVQEALTNVARHARATRVRVTARGDSEGMLSVEVADDGVGFAPAEAMAQGRLGLLGMHERARMLGGTIRVESGADKGSRLMLEIPMVSWQSQDRGEKR